MLPLSTTDDDVDEAPQTASGSGSPAGENQADAFVTTEDGETEFTWKFPDGADAHSRRPFFAAMAVDLVFPWVLAIGLGILTATSGVYISMNCDYFSDLRFGRCRGIPLGDRARCCGGSGHIDFITERCRPPVYSMLAAAERVIAWEPWCGDRSSHLCELWSFLVYLSLSVLLTAVAAFLVTYFCLPARGSGIPDVKAAVAGFSNNHCFSLTCLLVKTVGLSLVVGAGLSLGKEGPLIHIGACWAYAMHTSRGPMGVLANLVPLHEVLAVGAAAGVSTAFGAPVGGVLFAVEELGSTRSLSPRGLLLAFAGSFAASFTLKGWNLHGSNQLTLFELSTPSGSPKKEWLSWEIGLFLLLGIIGGLIGSCFVWVNVHVSRRRKRMLREGRLWMVPKSFQDAACERLPRWLIGAMLDDGGHPASEEVVRPQVVGSASPKIKLSILNVLELSLIALLTASVNFPTTELLRMPQSEVIHGLFESCPHSRVLNLGLCEDEDNTSSEVNSNLKMSLLFAAGIKFAQTAITFGAAVPSGLFIPSLFIGAAVGRLVGVWTSELSALAFGPSGMKNAIDPSVFAMVGAVATLGGFARMTVSLVVIMFELTAEVTLIPPFMCAVLAAKVVGDTFTDSIYDAHATLLGYANVEEPEDVRLMPQVRDIALPVAKKDMLNLAEPITVGVLRSLFDVEASGDGFEQGDDEMSPVSPQATVVGVRSTDCSASLFSPSSSQGTPSVQSEVCILMTGPGLDSVYGVMIKRELSSWLSREYQANARRLCRFRVDGDETLPVSNSTAPFDLSHLVDTNVGHLLMSAPVLTATCAFREQTKLKYCVCRHEHLPDVSGVLSRERLDEVLCPSTKFAAAFHDEELSLFPIGVSKRLLEIERIVSTRFSQGSSTDCLEG